MPNYISDNAKDLITRLLQPLPLKRITISEIKAHPWFKQDMPIYLQNLLNEKALQPQGRKRKQSYLIEDVDLDIVEQLFQVSDLSYKLYRWT